MPPPGATGGVGTAGALEPAGTVSMIECEVVVGAPTLHAMSKLRKKNIPAKIAVARDRTLAWPRTENSASVRPMPSPPPSLR